MLRSKFQLTLRRSWLLRLGAFGLLLACPFAACTGAPPPRSIVLIVVDTLRSDHLGAYGYDLPTSPEIDRFAESAVRIERAYATASWTRPSVASILTGVHPRTHGAVTISLPIAEDAPALAEILSKAGYTTAGIVSNIHLKPANGFARGFDSYDDSSVGDHKFVSSVLITDLAIAKLDELADAEEPFFLFVHYFDPHYRYLDHEGLDLAPVGSGTLNGDESMRELEERISGASDSERAFLVGRYDEEILFTDAQIGRLFDRIRERQLQDKAVIAVTADHGEEFGEHGHIGHGQLFEEVLRVPLMVDAPGLQAGVVASPVSLVALAPTLLDLAGVGSIAEGVPFSSESFAATLRGEPPKKKAVLFAESNGSQAVIRGRFKLLLGQTRGLFNLVEDSGETTDVAKSHALVLVSLKAARRAFVRDTPVGKSEPLSLKSRELELLRGLGYVESKAEPADSRSDGSARKR